MILTNVKIYTMEHDRVIENGYIRFGKTQGNDHVLIALRIYLQQFHAKHHALICSFHEFVSVYKKVN